MVLVKIIECQILLANCCSCSKYCFVWSRGEALQREFSQCSIFRVNFQSVFVMRRYPNPNVVCREHQRQPFGSTLLVTRTTRSEYHSSN